MTITFVRLKAYLEAIADAANLDASNSGHGRFWNTDYVTFVAGAVPHKQCSGSAVPIINLPDRTASAFFEILQGAWCVAPRMQQMPKTGPFVTDPGYSVALAGGEEVTGVQILQDIHDWLAAGAPEHG